MTLRISPTVVITFSSPKQWRSLLRGNFSALGDAYVSGGLKVEGRPEDIIEAGVRLSERLEKTPALGFLKSILNLTMRANSLDEDAANVRRHYNVSTEFYKLWLDKRLVYSCAYFHDGNEDIDLAQEYKLDHICRKLLLQADEKLLDVGCGWGALLHWAAERYGALGFGITLSERQFEEAQGRLAHLGNRTGIALQHYKELTDNASFDKIVSVGMHEHVGSSALPAYFRKMAALLKPGGMFLNHGIIATGGSKSGPSGGAFIERYVFPGGSVSSLSRIVQEIADAGLEVIDIEDLRPHYARTLMHWSEGLEQHKESAIEAAGAETYRIWRVYLAGMAYAFDRGWLSIAQVLALKPKDGRPSQRAWTRAHQYVS
ncbi:class I SAM-dependent methyltransferase [Methylocystis sp. IM2]|uniref:class I SAM-dependent methyltransferase n=1 Tax=Methylocystis sp. IM2 TaxID=3136563 RepID=UPI0030FAFB0C